MSYPRSSSSYVSVRAAKFIYSGMWLAAVVTLAFAEVCGALIVAAILPPLIIMMRQVNVKIGWKS